MLIRLLVRCASYLCAFIALTLLISGVFSKDHLFGIFSGLVMLAFACWIHEPSRTAILSRFGQAPTSSKANVLIGASLLTLFFVLGSYLSSVGTKKVGEPRESTGMPIVSNGKSPSSDVPTKQKPSAPLERACNKAKSAVLSATDAEGVCSVMERMLGRGPADEELQTVMVVVSKAVKTWNHAATDSASHIMAIVNLRGLGDDVQGVIRTASVLEKLATNSDDPVSPEMVVRYLSDHKDIAKSISDGELLNIQGAIASSKVYSEERDPMTGKLTKYETFESRNSVEFGFPYAGGTTARFFLRNHPQYGKV